MSPTAVRHRIFGIGFAAGAADSSGCATDAAAIAEGPFFLACSRRRDRPDADGTGSAAHANDESPSTKRSRELGNLMAGPEGTTSLPKATRATAEPSRLLKIVRVCLASEKTGGL